jgi:citrate lyase subunit beta/citryl-CoA lyase
VLAKAESKKDILSVDKMLAELEEEKGLRRNQVVIIPLLETAEGVLNAKEITRISDRIIALSFGALDFTRDMGTTLSEEGIEILYARSRIALIANAHNVQAIDTPWFDFFDEEGLVREAQLAKQLGFRGKLLIHPDQIEPINHLFSPNGEEVRYAAKVVKAFKEAEAKGLGAVSLDGKMIDTATYKQAKALLKYSNDISEKESEKSE